MLLVSSQTAPEVRGNRGHINSLAGREGGRAGVARPIGSALAIPVLQNQKKGCLIGWRAFQLDHYRQRHDRGVILISPDRPKWCATFQRMRRFSVTTRTGDRHDTASHRFVGRAGACASGNIFRPGKRAGRRRHDAEACAPAAKRDEGHGAGRLGIHRLDRRNRRLVRRHRSLRLRFIAELTARNGDRFGPEGTAHAFPCEPNTRITLAAAGVICPRP